MLQLIATHENIFVVEAFCVKNSLIPFPPPSYTQKKISLYKSTNLAGRIG